MGIDFFLPSQFELEVDLKEEIWQSAESGGGPIHGRFDKTNLASRFWSSFVFRLTFVSENGARSMWRLQAVE